MAMLVVLALGARAEPSSPPTLRVQGAPRPGGALFVTVPDVADPSGFVLHWLGGAYPLGTDTVGLRAVLPIAHDTKAGTFPLRLTGPDGIAVERSVVLQKVRFSAQSIWLPAAMLATYDSPRAKADDRLLLDAAHHFSPRRLWRGPFRIPAAGPLSTRYGQNRTYNGWRKGWHKGLDVAAESGAPICAPAGAVVAVVAPGQLVNGNATLLDHGLGVFSLYMHQSRIQIEKGDSVTKGRVIGRVGSSGAGTGPHLHWACYVHGVPVDPQVLLHAPW